MVGRLCVRGRWVGSNRRSTDLLSDVVARAATSVNAGKGRLAVTGTRRDTRQPLNNLQTNHLRTWRHACAPVVTVAVILQLCRELGGTNLCCVGARSEA